MEIPIETIKKVITQIENTIFPEEANNLTIPILMDDFTDLKMDGETVKTHELYFRKKDGVWYMINL